MPYCPKCGYEYEPGIKVCPDCEEELVEELTEDNFDNEIVEVFSTYEASEAGMVKELLKGEGIFCALSNELGSGVWGGSIGEESEVNDSDARRARGLIETYLEGNPLESTEEFIVCGNCGAKVDQKEEFCPVCGERFEE
jgi:predicted amidophosphoribosyltransferase